MTTIYDKTPKGREEIATRKYQLAPRLRTLLVLVDGKQAGEELLKKVAGLGLTDQGIRDLLEEGFIQALVPLASTLDAPAEREEATGAEDVLPPGQSQFQAIYAFYTATIKSTIGLRGYALQLKVEKASSIADFRALRQPYLETVLRAKGNEMARSLRARLDQLLYLGEEAPTSTTIAGLGAANVE